MGYDVSILKRALDCCLSSNRNCKNCPFRNSPILGSCTDSIKFLVDQFCEFYEMFYVPNCCSGGRVRRSLSTFRRLSKILDNIDYFNSEGF